MEIKRGTCLLCGIGLIPTELGVQQHPQVDDCTVTHTDAFGVAVDFDPKPTIEDDGIVGFNFFPLVDDVLQQAFAEHGLPRLGGQSTGRGWSNVRLFQQCPYAWKRRYVDNVRSAALVESPSLAVGSLVHAFLALHYTGMMDSPYAKLTPEMLFKRMRAQANPDFVTEAWRIFSEYLMYYQGEEIVPLAVEYDLKDPRTNESCRYDLIAYFPEERPGFLPGTYAIEHKTASRFDSNTIDGWANDGEVIGQVALWRRLGLDKRFGTLRGALVNILGKQKECRFHRTVVSPDSFVVDQHLEDLKRWEGLIQLSQATQNFPRARAGCIGRYGRCDHWDHCIGAL